MQQPHKSLTSTTLANAAPAAEPSELPPACLAMTLVNLASAAAEAVSSSLLSCKAMAVENCRHQLRFSV